MAKELKPTTRIDLPAVMKAMAEALENWADRRDQDPAKADFIAAKEARSLAGEIRLCVGQIELTDSMADGEAATRRLQQLRSNALELLARHK